MKRTLVMWLWGLVLALPVLAGCANEGHDKFIPPEDRARTALESALTAWQNGERSGVVIKGTPAVYVEGRHVRGVVGVERVVGTGGEVSQREDRAEQEESGSHHQTEAHAVDECDACAHNIF